MSATGTKKHEEPLEVGSVTPRRPLRGEYTEVETLKIHYIKGAEATTADAASAALVASIREHGILGPLMIGRTPDGTLYLLGGYKRLDAAAKLRLTAVPAVVLEVADDREALRLFQELHATRTTASDIHEGKFMAAASLPAMPDYLL